MCSVYVRNFTDLEAAKSFEISQNAVHCFGVCLNLSMSNFLINY